MPESLNQSIRSNYFISKYSALQNGNQKRQPEEEKRKKSR